MFFPIEIFVDSYYKGSPKVFPDSSKVALFDFSNDITDINCYDFVEILNIYNVQVFPLKFAEFLNCPDNYRKIHNYTKYSLNNRMAISPIIKLIQYNEEPNPFSMLKHAADTGSSESTSSALVFHDRKLLIKNMIAVNNSWLIKHLRMEYMFNNTYLIENILEYDADNLLKYLIENHKPKILDIANGIIKHESTKCLKLISFNVSLNQIIINHMFKIASEQGNKNMLIKIMKNNYGEFITKFTDIVRYNNFHAMEAFVSVFQIEEEDVDFVEEYGSEGLKTIVRRAFNKLNYPKQVIPLAENANYPIGKINQYINHESSQEGSSDDSDD